MKTIRKPFKLADCFDTIGEALAIYIAVLLASAGLFALFEDKSYWDSVWWAVVTATTVGYGDVYPTTVPGRIVAFCLMHFTILILLPVTIGHVCVHLIKNKHEFTHDEQEEIKQKLDYIIANIKKDQP